MQALSAAPKPKSVRLSLSEILALMLTKSGHDSESVEVTRNAKGQFQFSVTARTTDTETLDEAFARVSDVVCQLVARFPYENGGA